MFNLPDWKGTLQEVLNNYVKAPLENKANDLQTNLESKFKEFKELQQKFQKTVIALLLATFLVITVNLSFKDYD